MPICALDHPGDRARPWAKGMRGLVLTCLHALGTATVEELATATGKGASAIGPRLTELGELGQARSWSVVSHGRRGRPKKVWTYV